MGKTKAIGIDLGTTYSCVAVWLDGKVRVLSNEYGSYITPSCVAFDGDLIFIGNDAVDQVILNPKNTIFNCKRLIGRKFDDPEVQEDIKHWPFKVIEEANKPMIQVEYNNSVNKYYPEEISALILGKMKDIAEKFLGEKVQDAVITVPAYFNNSQRQATKIAGEIAGLNVLKIISEPTAAALAYGVEIKTEEEKKILVYDLGGGTFDVSILSLNGTDFVVKATSGNTHLGGEDFNNKIVEHCAEIIKRRFKKDIYEDHQGLSRLCKQCEKAKVKLSNQENADITVDCLFEDELGFKTILNRSKFEELNCDLFQNTIKPIKSVLEDSGIHEDCVDEVLMVGGSIRIPKIKQLVSEFFGNKHLNYTINPDEAIACGAAIQANILGNEKCEKIAEISLFDVNPLSIGTRTTDDVMAVVIPRNSPIPSKFSKFFYTNQDNVNSFPVDIYEGERAFASDNNFLGSFSFYDITPAKRGHLSYIDTYKLDENGILDIEVLEEATGKKINNKINFNDKKLSSKRAYAMIKSAKANKSKDDIAIARVRSLKNLEDLAYELRDIAEDNTLNHMESQILLSAASLELDWIKGSRSATESIYAHRYSLLRSLSDPIVNRKNIKIENETDGV